MKSVGDESGGRAPIPRDCVCGNSNGVFRHAPCRVNRPSRRRHGRAPASLASAARVATSSARRGMSTVFKRLWSSRPSRGTNKIYPSVEEVSLNAPPGRAEYRCFSPARCPCYAYKRPALGEYGGSCFLEGQGTRQCRRCRTAPAASCKSAAFTRPTGSCTVVA